MDTILFAYSAHKSHLSFIPTGATSEKFAQETSDYVVKKDSIQFSYKMPLPAELIRKIGKHGLEDVVIRGAKWKY